MAHPTAWAYIDPTWDPNFRLNKVGLRIDEPGRFITKSFETREDAKAWAEENGYSWNEKLDRWEK